MTDLDELMQRIREEIRANTSMGRERSMALVSAPNKGQPALPRRRPLLERLDPRKLIHRLLGIRDLVKLGQQLKSAQHGPKTLAALPHVVDELKCRLASTEAVVEDIQRSVAEHRARLQSMDARLQSMDDTCQKSKLN